MKELKKNIERLESRLLNSTQDDNPCYRDEMQCLFDMKDALNRARALLDSEKND